jgi:serine/threonine-protein kinase HipA
VLSFLSLKAMASLNIWVAGEHAATLQAEEGNFSLRYSAAWQTHAKAFAVSPHLPLGQISPGACVKHFFSNLLPEGQPLEALSRAHQVSQYDVFGMMRKVGRDCAGALVITEEDTAPPEEKVFNAGEYEAVSREDLQERITQSREQEVPLMFWRGKRRMSLPGVQNKIGVYVAQDGGFWLPRDGAPTSHILKLGNARHPDMAANEYACMRLAHSMGLPVPQAIYTELPEPVLLVQRYDRLWTPDGGLLRIHQIDACQALNLPPEQKYEEPDYETAPPGPSFAQLLALHKLCLVPASAQVLMLQWLMFNYIIGNSDAHAKNFSFLVNEKGMQAAPLYDLVSGLRFGYPDMAQSIGGETHLSVINTEDWKRLAKDCEIPFNLLQRLGKPLIAKVEGKAKDLQNRLLEEATGSNADTVQFVCQLAVERAGFLKEHLAS